MLNLRRGSLRPKISAIDTLPARNIQPGRTIPLFSSTGVLVHSPYYLVQLAIISLILYHQLDIGGRDLSIPINFRGDTVYQGAIVNSIIRDGWWWYVHSLGAPTGFGLVAMPILGNLDCAVMKILSLFTHKAGLLLNVYWILTILIAGPIATWCLTRLGVNRWIAGVVGILYALSPHVYYRNTAHLGLTHHLIPLACTIAALLAVGQRERLRGPTLYILLSGCVLIGFSYIYWAFFGCFVILMGTAVGFLRTREYWITRIGGLSAVLLIVSAAANLLPSAASWMSEPSGRTMLSFKNAGEADLYGLKIRHLISPTSHTPLPMFDAIAAKLQSAQFPLDGVNESTSLSRIGAVAATGLFILVLSMFFLAPPTPSMEILKALAALTLACILLGTVGGFGSLFNVFIRPDIRAYNRIAIFIAFYSLAALSIVLTRALALIPASGLTTAGSAILLSLLMLIGVADQNESQLLRAVKVQDEKKFRILSDFVGRIEQDLPRNAMIYQLPHVGYGDGDRSAAPRDPRLWQSAPEEPFLLSTSVRWSFPAVSNEAISFARRLQTRAAPDMVDALRQRGFLGVYIDRFGYADDAKQIVANLRDDLWQEPLQSADGRYVFFNLGIAKRDRIDHQRYSWGTPLVFAAASNWMPYFGEGWSCEGCTEGKIATMDFTVDPPSSDVTIRALLIPSLFGKIQEQPVRVFANATQVGEWKVRTRNWYSATLPRRVLENKQRLSLRFELPNAASPQSLRLNSDRRVLGVQFEQITMLTSSQAAIPQIGVAWGGGAYEEERDTAGNWHWCSTTCQVQLSNPSKTSIPVQIDMGVQTTYPQLARFTIVGPSISDVVPVNVDGKSLTYRFTLPPGQHTLKMSSDAKLAQAAPDPRKLVFKVENFTIRPGSPVARKLERANRSR